jgi:predicted RNase H-like HicB family nuclease
MTARKIELMNLILEYWKDAGWYVGRIKEIPGVFSQGKTLKELRGNIREAYELVLAEDRDRLPLAFREKAKETRLAV